MYLIGFLLGFGATSSPHLATQIDTSIVHCAATKVTDRAAEDFRLPALTGDSFRARRTIFCQPRSSELDEISIESLRHQAEAGDQ
jgi:hypothetical protein